MLRAASNRRKNYKREKQERIDHLICKKLCGRSAQLLNFAPKLTAEGGRKGRRERGKEGGRAEGKEEEKKGGREGGREARREETGFFLYMLSLGKKFFRTPLA